MCSQLNSSSKFSKPIARWTIGPFNQHAFDMLQEAIGNFQQIYPEFAVTVCHNNLSKTQQSWLPQVNLVNQNQHIDCLPYPPKGPAWKIYPPRLDLHNHELFMDNDLILYDRVDAIDDFLTSREHCLVSEAIKRSYETAYDYLVGKEFNINTGLFGVPPELDLHQELTQLMDCTWKGHFHEQTLVAAILQKLPSYRVPLKQVSVCLPTEDFRPGRCGIHLVGANNGDSKHWKTYKSRHSGDML